MKTEQLDNRGKERGWTRREVLAAGGATLLALAGCGTNTNVPHAISGLAPAPTLPPTATPVPQVTLAFTGDVMFGRTVNSHMLDTALNDPYPFTYTA